MIAASLIVAVGAIVQGSAGFGLNLVSVPVLVLINPLLVPGPTLANALVLTVFMAHRERSSINLPEVKWAFIGRIPGTIVGAAAVALLPVRELSVALGLIVLAGVAMSIAGRHFDPTPRVLLGAGALSGLMGTTSSIGGPPMALVYQRRDGADLRGTLSGYFVIGGAFSLAVLAIVGKFGPPEILASLVLIPGTLIGFVISSWTKTFLDRGHLRTAVLVLSAASAVAVLLKALL